MDQAVLRVEKEIEDKWIAIIARFEYRQSLINQKLDEKRNNSTTAQKYQAAKDGE